MTTDLHIVLSCTNRKRAPSDDYPRLRDVGLQDVSERAAAWIEMIGPRPPTTEASRLYAGEYWRAGMALAETAGQFFATKVWILSAGLGLISAADVVPAYGATFSAGHRDSVVPAGTDRPPGDVRRDWWSLLASWRGPAPDGQPRTVNELAAAEPSATTVVCAGREYVNAIASDLKDARTSMGSPSRLLVFASGPPDAELEGAWVGVPGRVRMRLGGSMASTGPRAAQAAIEAHGPTGELDPMSARALVRSLAEACAPLPRFDRKRLSEDEVASWISTHVASHPGATKSTALRRFRNDGMACEQSRFGRLFDEAVGAAR